MAIQRGYVNVSFGQVHVRMAGAGAPVALLHASPLHAGFLAAQIDALAPDYFAVGIDTPGYGGSDPLPEGEVTLGDYADAVLETMAGLGAENFALYGAATGAQIALAVARRAPDRVTRMVLDNCGAFAPADRSAWEPHYFPDFTPQPDGSHLARIWAFCAAQTQRFPWHLPSTDERPPAPTQALAAMTLATLQAGPGYDRAYRLAFRAEDPASFAGLLTPTVLIDWADSIVARELRALIDAGLPPCVRVRPAGPGLAGRLAAIRAGFAE
jgi:pimeloyl-ACP methyl ester carboxylesterase